MQGNRTVYRLAVTALMAALCYVAFTFIQIKIPTPAGMTSFHLGNVFCVLAALMFDGITGGIAGAIGMGIGDLFDPAYVLTTPKTVFLKFFIGLVTGFFAHHIFHLKTRSGNDLRKYTFVSAGAGMLFNIIGEPLVSYFYYKLILGNATKALSYLTIAKWVTTSVNAVLTVIIAGIFYLVLRKRINN